MNPLDDQDLIILEGKGTGLLPAPVQLEAVEGGLDLLSLDQGLHLMAEVVQVQGMDGFPVRGAIRCQGLIPFVPEIVIQRDGHRLQAADPELGGKALGEGGLS